MGLFHQKLQSRIQPLTQKLHDKEHEETVVGHSLSSHKDQGNFTEKDTHILLKEKRALEAKYDTLGVMNL